MKTKKITFIYLAFLVFHFTLNAQYQFTQVDDINPGFENSFPKFPIEANGLLFFNATINNQEKLFKTTNGTNAELVAEINGSSGYSPIPFATINNKLLFFATTSAEGTELFVTDGTSSGTSILKDIYPGSAGIISNYIIDQFAVLNGQLYFWTKGQDNHYFLWKTDGTTTGTVQVTPDNDGFFNPSKVMLVYNNMIYFDAKKNSFDNYSMLFRTDGTASGTALFQDIPITIVMGSNPTDFIVYNNLLYYSAGNDNGQFGKELWRTDGTVAGTELVADIFPNNITNSSKGSSPAHFIIFNNELYFRAKGFDIASNQSIGNEFFKYNSNDGVVLVKDFYPGALSGIDSGKPFFIMDNMLYIIARDGSTGGFEELWKTADGTSSGVSKAVSLSDLDVGSGGFGDVLQFDNGIVMNDKFYFVNVFNSFLSLWVTSGDSASTENLTNPVDSNSSIPFLDDFRNSNIIFNNELYFAASNNDGVELWKITDTSLSIQEQTWQDKIIIYPNPSSAYIHIKTNENLNNQKAKIYNTLGTLIKEQKMDNSIYVGDLENGLYILNFTLNGQQLVRKFIKN